MEVEWREAFAEAYMRTYKRAAADSKKNLRCFPCCTPRGHRKTGFCGCPIHLRVKLAAPSPVAAWARFEEADAEPRWQRGDRIARSELAAHERSRNAPLNEWLRSSVALRHDGAEFTFNESLIGWHYQWLSTKATCNVQHCFRVYIMTALPEPAKDGSQQLHVLGFADSPRFSLFTRHRFQGATVGPSGSAETAATNFSADQQSDPALSVQATEHDADGPTNAGSTVAPPGAGETLLSSGGIAEPKRPHPAPPYCGKRRAGPDFDSDTELPGRPISSFAKQTCTIPRNRTIDRLSRFIFRYGMAPDPETLSRFEMKSQDEEIIGDLELVLDLLMQSEETPEPRMLAQPDPRRAVTHGSGTWPCDGDAQYRDESPREPDWLSDQDTQRSVSGSATAEPPEHFGGVPSDAPWLDGQGGATPFRHSEVTSSPSWSEASSQVGSESSRQSQPSWETYGSGEVVKLLEQVDSTAAQSFTDNINALARACIKEAKPGSQSSRYFKNAVQRWGTVDGLSTFHTRLEVERNLDFEWTPLHEDEAFDPHCENLRENSFFAELRHGFRMLIEAGLHEAGQTAEQYGLAMDLACKERILTPDPFYPPTQTIVAFLRLQLYGRLDAMPEEDYGSVAGVFRDEAQQRRYAKDLLVARRRVYRSVLLGRLAVDRRLEAELRIFRPPAPQGYDVSGRWRVEKRQVLAPHLFVGIHDVFSALTEKAYGSLFGAAFFQMYATVKLRVDSEVLIIEGEPVLLAHPKCIVRLGGQVCKLIRPLPLPPETLEPCQVRSTYGRFTTDGTDPGVLYVHCGGAQVTNTHEMIQRCRRKLADPNAEFQISAQRGLYEWFAQLREEDYSPDDAPSVHVAQFYARKGEKLRSELAVWLFARENASQFNDATFLDMQPPPFAYLLTRARNILRQCPEDTQPDAMDDFFWRASAMDKFATLMT